MCGRFELHANPQLLAEKYEADISQVKDWTAHYNVSPSQPAPVLFGDGQEREFQFARFGMRPDWWKQRGRDFINLRAETIKEKPFFRRQLEQHRCLLPVSGFYEWKPAGKFKQPYRFAATKEDGLLSLACIWEVDQILGHDQVCFAILTGPPNSVAKPIHDRMPIILPDSALDTWLNPEAAVSDLLNLLKPFPASQLRAYPVSRRVSNPANEGPDLIKPAADSA
jgi:putative SOS response-associated peptidase YedK